MEKRKTLSELFEKGKRKQTLKMEALLAEFKALKAEFFETSEFRLVDDHNDPKDQRYNQLLGFFYPQFRYRGWTNPLYEKEE